MKTTRKQNPTKAQKVFGAKFDNTPIINERPDYLRDPDPTKDKEGFQRYKAMLREQVRTIKSVLR